MSELARSRCAACSPETPRLSRDEARAAAEGLDEAGWVIGDTSVEREFRFKSFNAAFGLATRVALLAESQGHHPEIEVGWGRLHIRFTTHAIGGLSENDLVMAAKVQRLAEPKSSSPG